MDAIVTCNGADSELALHSQPTGLEPPAASARAALEATAKRPGQNRALIFICMGIFSALSIWFCASAVLVPLMGQWDISNTQASFLTSIVNVGFCVGCLGSACTSLADFMRPQCLILAGCFGAAAANASLVLVHGLPGALVCRFMVGLFLSLVYPPGVKLLSTWFSAQHRGTAIGVMFGAFCLGSAFPQLLRSIVARHSWKPVVICTSGAAAISGTLIFTLVGVGPFPFPSMGSFSAANCAKVVCSPSVGLAIVAYSGHMWELFCVWAWIARFIEESWHLSSFTAPLLAFTVISMGGPGSWIGGMLGDRYGRVRVATVSLTTSGMCVAILGLLAHEGHLVIRVCIFLLWGLTGLSDSPQFSAIITTTADQRFVGTAVTVQLLCGYLVTVVALWVVPHMANSISWRWSFFSLAVGPLVGVTALLCMGWKGIGEVPRVEEQGCDMSPPAPQIYGEAHQEFDSAAAL